MGTNITTTTMPATTTAMKTTTMTTAAPSPAGAYKVVNPSSGKCIDICQRFNFSDGACIQLYACNGQPNQHWEIRGGQLVNTPSGKCPDIDRFDFADTAKIQLHSCNGGANQDWTLQSAVFIGE